MDQNWSQYSQAARQAWEKNAAFWDEYMQEGNDFQRVLIGPIVERLLEFDFGEPPHSLIFLGELHFMEAEALMAFAGAPTKLRNVAK